MERSHFGERRDPEINVSHTISKPSEIKEGENLMRPTGKPLEKYVRRYWQQ